MDYNHKPKEWEWYEWHCFDYIINYNDHTGNCCCCLSAVTQNHPHLLCRKITWHYLIFLALQTSTMPWQHPTRRHSIPISNPCWLLVTPPSECWWISVLVCKVLVCKMNLLTLWPWPLTFEPKKVPLLGYPKRAKVIPYTKFEHFGIIHLKCIMYKNNNSLISCNK